MLHNPRPEALAARMRADLSRAVLVALALIAGAAAVGLLLLSLGGPEGWVSLSLAKSVHPLARTLHAAA